MAGEDPKYIAHLRELPCAVHPCIDRSGPPHHHTDAPTFAPGERPAKALGGKKGKSQRAADYYAMPLCVKHHDQLHQFRGPFAGMSNGERAAWQDKQVSQYREPWEARDEESPKPLTGAKSSKPRPTVDQEAEAFCAYHSLGVQILHDLKRLLHKLESEGVF